MYLFIFYCNLLGGGWLHFGDSRDGPSQMWRGTFKLVMEKQINTTEFDSVWPKVQMEKPYWLCVRDCSLLIRGEVVVQKGEEACRIIFLHTGRDLCFFLFWLKEKTYNFELLYFVFIFNILWTPKLADECQRHIYLNLSQPVAVKTEIMVRWSKFWRSLNTSCFYQDT